MNRNRNAQLGKDQGRRMKNKTSALLDSRRRVKNHNVYDNILAVYDFSCLSRRLSNKALVLFFMHQPCPLSTLSTRNSNDTIPT